MSTKNQAELVRLAFEQDRQIAIITLNDPKRGNAMSAAMGDAFQAIVQELKTAEKLRVAVIRGEGRDFSIGGHRDMLQKVTDGSKSEAELETFMLGFYNRWLTMLDIPVPTISVIQGACIGVAPIFFSATDIAISEETARIEVTFAGLGLYPGMGMTQLLPQTAGPQHAARLLYSGDPIDGLEAARIGLAAKSAAPGKGLEEALALAKRIAANAPETVRLLVKNLRPSRASLTANLQQNATQQAHDFGTAEYKQRISNYLPDFYSASASQG